MIENKAFVHLHVHTEYSLLDGAAQIGKLVKRAASMGAPAIAITDHGNMYGAIKFYNECHSNNIKPILGCEFYVAPGDLSKKEGKISEEANKANHLVLIAKNLTGFYNLAKLNSIAYIDGFYYKPRIDLTVLEKYKEGLICTSACLAGAIPRYLMQNDYESAKNYALKLKSIFDDGDFYIEVQDHGIPEQKATNPLLVQIANEIGVKYLATNDVHYINKDDAEMQEVMLCIQTATTMDDPNRMKFSSDEFYLKSYEEMSNLFSWCPDALTTPYEIIEKCDVKIKFKDYQIPPFDCPDGLNPEQYLRKLADEGLKKRYKVITNEIKERAEYELSVIITMGFAEYYLIVWDFINYAHSKDIPVGAGRGSGVGSIIAYAIEITNVDPIKYSLIFERFLNLGRTSMPDFDIDFCFDRRGEVIDYVKAKYGVDKTSQIITFGKLKKKAAIKDVARVFNIPYAEVSKLTKYITDKDNKVHIGDLINVELSTCVPELVEAYSSNPLYKKVIDLAIKLENMPRNTSVHAAGVVIYKRVASDVMPLARNGDEITTQFDMKEVEELGLLKMDFLALKTLTDVKMAHDYVLNRKGVNIDFNDLGYDDPEVYKLISTGATDAVFQLESGGMKKFMSRLKPDTFEEIIAGISLYRPGPMDYIDRFIENKLNPAKIDYRNPLLESVLKVTYGVIVYQEQAMHITRSLAGYDMTRADKFRAIISKKKEKAMEEEEPIFINGLDNPDGTVKVLGCVRNGMTATFAAEIYAELKKFGKYAFNKSHAAAYAVLSYETAYYMRYFPVEFLASVINNRINSPDDTSKYMRVLKEMNIKLLPPDINHSLPLFAPQDGAVRYGLACIKNVGKVAMETVCAERSLNGEYTSLHQFISRVGTNVLNKRMLESLIKGGAFDCFGLNRATMLTNYEGVLAKEDSDRKLKDSGQFNIFDLLKEDNQEEDYHYEVIKEYNSRERLLYEKEMLGMYVTGHPLEGYEDEFKNFNFNTSMLPHGEEDLTEGEEESLLIKEENSQVTDGMEVRTGGILTEVSLKRTKDGKEMAVCLLEDMYDKIEILMFSMSMLKYKRNLIKDSLVRVRGRLTLRDGDLPKITVNEITPWDLQIKEDKEIPIINDKRVLFINIKGVDINSMLAKVDSVLNKNVGGQEVKLQIDGALYSHPVKITNIETVAKEIIGILGAQNVKIK